MEVRILGAHSAETKNQRMVSLLIDGILALDAGGLTSSLSLSEQQRIRAVLLTHHHFDHSRDLVTLAANGAKFTSPVDIYALRYTLEVLNFCLLDGKMYADFSKWPSKEKPYLRQKAIEPLQPQNVLGYKILPVPVQHAVPAIGFQVKSKDGKSLFYTGDTGPRLEGCWQHISPQLLVIEISGRNKDKDFLQTVGHLSPELLKDVLIQFRQIKGYLPCVVVIHIPPQFDKEIKREVKRVARELRIDIDISYEDMKIRI